MSDEAIATGDEHAPIGTDADASNTPTPDAAPPTSEDVDYEEITVNGRTYRMEKGLRSALEAATPPQPPQPPIEKQPAPAEPDLSVLWFTDPAKAAQIVEDRAYARARQDYQMVEAGKRFWSEFERRNPTLVRARRVAEKIVQTEPKYATMDDETAYRVLAEDTRAMLREAVESTGTDPVHLERSTRAPRAQVPASKGEPPIKEQPPSLSDWVRAKRKQRFGGKAS